MKKFLARAERAAVRVLVTPALRPIEEKAARAAALSVLARVGASAATTAVVLELISRLG